MADSQEGCCRCCCSFVFTLGLTALFMWLSLRADKPKCSITNFYLPALNRTLNEFNNSTDSSLNFTLKLSNPNKDKGINYDDVEVNITVFDRGPGNAPFYLGNYTVPRFYQGHKKKAQKQGHLEYNKTMVSKAIYSNGTAEFQLEMVTQVRFKILFWRTKRHKINVKAKFAVDDKGTQVNPRKKKDVPLTSTAPKRGYCNLVMGILVNFVVLKFPSFW
ncbi:hypothetical protein SLE2022_017830 [Rubroshorea leprosula]